MGPPVPLEGERWPGGEGSRVIAVGSNAFSFPAGNLTREQRRHFFVGNAFFNQAWTSSPSSTTARDGVGPLFHATSCSTCHFRDGRGQAPEEGGVLLEGVVKLQRDGAPDPHWGGQLQPFGIGDLLGEALPVVNWEEVPGAYPDGTEYTLRRPILRLENPAYGGDVNGLVTSMRIAPAMIGLGLLEAIEEENILALADPDDSNGDGISGRVQRTEDGRLGRFGWKAGTATVAEQVAAAFSGDMGLTSSLRPDEQCTSAQDVCTPEAYGAEPGEPEVQPRIFEAMVVYSQALAVPPRPFYDDEGALEGRVLMDEVGCTSCHTQVFVTGRGALGDDTIQAMEGQLIFPYTDLLLHDMGPELADGFTELEANGQEWRTPPLWGIGRADDVGGGEAFFLHDGRARTFEEAILWHGGEAEASREAFMNLPAEEREKLLRFLRSQ